MIKGKTVLSAYIVVFALVGFFELFNHKLVALDYFTGAIICGVMLLLSKKYEFSFWVSLLTGLVFVPNIIGQIMGYQVNIWGYHYDWIVHTTVAFFGTTAMILFLKDNKMTKSFAKSATVALLFVMTVGAFVEISEYWGFRVFGFGESYLAFGEGDNSQNFGPWENSSIDSTLNLFGSLIGVAISSLMIAKKSKSNRLKS